MSLLNYVPYLLSCPTCSCPTCSRVLRASCSTCCRASPASCTTCSRALRALMPQVPRTLRAFVPTVLLYPTYLVPYVLLCLHALCSMWPRALRFMSPFSLRTLLFRTLRTLCPNFTFFALEFPCITLLFLCSFATCDFFEEFY